MGAGQGNPLFFRDPDFAKIAEDHNATPAQISVSWLVQRGTPPLAKSANVERMRKNITVSLRPEVEFLGSDLTYCDIDSS